MFLPLAVNCACVACDEAIVACDCAIVACDAARFASTKACVACTCALSATDFVGTVGATTPAAGTFTTLTATTGVYAGGAGSNVDLNVYSKGTGSVIFNTTNGAGFKVIDTGSTATH